MKQGAWRLVGLLALICMVAEVVVAAAMGGCDHMLETTTAGEVPMKCHWTFVAAAFTGVVGIVSTAASIFAKSTEGRRIAALMTLVTCVIVALYPTSFAIGLCANAAMHCHTTALVVWILVAVAAILAIVQLVKANVAQASKPKMQL